MHAKAKNVITHLLQVLFQPFQRGSLICYQFFSVGLREEDGGTTTEREQVWGSSGDVGANFFGVADAGGWEGSARRDVILGASGNAFGCWEQDAKGLVSIGLV
jgi:hypothetical protein